MTLEHEMQYRSERQERWNNAAQYEEYSIQAIVAKIQRLDTNNEIKNISYERYDKKWLNENIEWTKGCPDYKVKIEFTSEQVLLFEVKIKNKEFLKTLTGGATRNGSVVPNYGCTSYYLDVEPVYKNMNDFCINTKISSNSFVIAFVKAPNTNQENTEIRVISLAKLNYLLQHNNGNKEWNNQPICYFKEGYGQGTYLIPKTATTDLDKLTIVDIQKMTMSAESFNNIESVIEAPKPRKHHRR